MKFSALNKEASNSSVLSTPSSKKGRPTQEAQVDLGLWDRMLDTTMHIVGVSMSEDLSQCHETSARKQMGRSEGTLL